ncbi:hypothetical protein Y032_0007g3473 [Ancylostoma ceylanicum]|uniref:Knottin scorpion toxin-like domain-containing protein n=1 Tax=Ancylostoma ceylanicum TaxID=53326 RepID=A0A016VNG3_9BILA|nr:hypothetical protein Y032_0007g3473 [Ancylostoma ceylanicum]
MRPLFVVCLLSILLGEVVWCKHENSCTLYHNVAIGSKFCRLQCKGVNCQGGHCVLRSSRKTCLCTNCWDKAGDNIELDVLRGEQ